MRNKSIILSFVALFFTTSCVPHIYLLDRPTLLEEEAAGEWVDLEQVNSQKAIKTKPEPLTPEQMTRSGERVLQTLEGDPGLNPKAEPTKSPTPAKTK